MSFLGKIITCIVFVLGGTLAKAQTTNHQAYSVFVISIAKYSNWPVHEGEFKIVVVGKSKVYDELLKVSAQKDVNGMKMVVIQVEDPSQVGDANIVYLPDNKSSHLDDVLKTIQGKATMVITEREGLFKKGAGFSFVILDNNALRFDINNTELEKRQIKISKNLSTLANSVI